MASRACSASVNGCDSNGWAVSRCTDWVYTPEGFTTAVGNRNRNSRPRCAPHAGWRNADRSALGSNSHHSWWDPPWWNWPAAAWWIVLIKACLTLGAPPNAEIGGSNCGYNRSRSSALAQCVVTVRPSSRPAAASAKLQYRLTQSHSGARGLSQGREDTETGRNLIVRVPGHDDRLRLGECPSPAVSLRLKPVLVVTARRVSPHTDKSWVLSLGLKIYVGIPRSRGSTVGNTNTTTRCSSMAL